MQSKAYKNYLVTVLLVISAFCNVDRIALGILLQEIKVDLSVSDTQLGLLTGIAFAVFYSVMGIPIARWADRGNRVTIISIAAALSSAAVVICGAATSFVQLLLIRIGVAVGQAGCVPPAHSLIADYFTRAERPRAASIYGLAGPLAFVMGYFLAGWLNEFYGWRATFILLGAPGLALSAVAWFTLREPRRTKLNPNSTEVAGHELTVSPWAHPSFKEVCVTLWANVTFRHLLFSFSALQFVGNAVSVWQPTFFMRSYGLKTGEIGTWFAAIYGLGGAVGVYLGGKLASRHAAHKENRQLKAMAVAIANHGLMSILVYLSPNQYVAFALLAVTCVVAYAVFGPIFGTVQTLVPESMRATSIAVIYLFANLVGMGLGPLAAGTLSDVLKRWVGDASLRYALLLLAPSFFWAAWHLWRASQTVESDITATQDQNATPSRAPRKSLFLTE